MELFLCTVEATRQIVTYVSFPTDHTLTLQSMSCWCCFPHQEIPKATNLSVWTKIPMPNPALSSLEWAFHGSLENAGVTILRGWPTGTLPAFTASLGWFRWHLSDLLKNVKWVKSMSLGATNQWFTGNSIWLLELHWIRRKTPDFWTGFRFHLKMVELYAWICGILSYQQLGQGLAA